MADQRPITRFPDMSEKLDLSDPDLVMVYDDATEIEQRMLWGTMKELIGAQAPVTSASGANQTLAGALDDRVVRVGSVAEMEALSPVAGITIYLSEEGRAGTFKVKTGTPPTDTGKGVYFVLANGNYAERQYTGKTYREWFDTLQSWIDYCVANSLEPGAATLFNQENTWTVDTSGANFTTVTSAFKFLYSANNAARQVKGSNTENIRQTVNMEAGYVFSEQVWFENCDLSFIELTSTDAEVTIDRSALTRPVGAAVLRYMAFNFRFSCRSPIISVLFTMDTTGTATNRGGIRVEAGSYAYVSAGAGVKNAAERGLHLVNSNAWANNTIFDGAGGVGVRCGNVSTLWADGVSAQNCQTGCSIDGPSIANLAGANFSTATLNGLQAYSGATVRADTFTATGCGDFGLDCIDSIVYCENSTITGNRRNISISDGGRVYSKLSTLSGATEQNLIMRNGCGGDFHNADLSGAGTNAVDIGTGCAGVDLSNTDITNAGGIGILAQTGCHINANNADTTGFGGSHGVLVSSGSIVNFNGGTGTTNITVNTITSSGIIFG